MTKSSEGSESEVPKTIIVGSDTSRWSELLTPLKNKPVLIIVAFVLILVIGLGIWKINSGTTSEVVSISNEQFAKQTLNDLRKAPPASNTSLTEKISYRNALVENELRLGSYDNALADYKELLKLVEGTDEGSALIFANGAAVYAAMGNKQAALVELNKAQVAAEKIKDPMTREMSLMDLKEQRKGIE